LNEHGLADGEWYSAECHLRVIDLDSPAEARYLAALEERERVNADDGRVSQQRWR
jgi:hypothetical protein